MPVFVAGASGATGRLLVQQLLAQGQTVRAVVRRRDSLPDSFANHPQLEVTEASILDLGTKELAELVCDCDAVASCLGHNITFKGLFGPPRRLVTEATRRLCAAIRANHPTAPVRFVLMNTTANRNRDIAEPRSLGDKAVFGLLRLVLPPHADNEQAADFLRTSIGQNDPVIGWTAVRPDGLFDAATVTPYDIFTSPTRSAVFNAGATSRINVAHFMAQLMLDDAAWANWQGQMPVIYNRGSS
jgi:putative NADH-flavin reductase